MRPCFLVIDRNFPGAISTRKLVIETAKCNVITAYSGQEAVEALDRFPNVDGVVMDHDVDGASCAELIHQLRAVRGGDLPVVVVSPSGLETCNSEQYRVSGMDPKDLLARLQEICVAQGRPVNGL